MSKATILVIEDDKPTRDLLSVVLAKEGYAPVLAAGGEEGLAAVKAHKPDLILLDLMMPIVDGIDVLKRLRETKNDLPVIVYSATPDRTKIVDSFRLGAKEYLIKGTQPKELLQIVKRVLDEDAALRENRRLRRQLKGMQRELIDANARLEKQLDEVQALHYISKKILQLSSLDDILLSILSEAILRTRGTAGSIYLLSSDHLQAHITKNHVDESPIVITNDTQPDDYHLARHVIEQETAKIIRPDKGALSGSIALPMIVGERIVGVLVTRLFEQNATIFSDQEMFLLYSLANYAALAVDNAAQYRALPDDQTRTQDTPTIFVSYSRDDWHDYVEPLTTLLQNEGFTLWIDHEQLKPGDIWWDVVNDVLDDCGYMLLFLTPRALESKHVRMEYRSFIDVGKPILPVICEDGSRLPVELRYIQHLHFTEHEALITHLRATLSAH